MDPVGARSHSWRVHGCRGTLVPLSWPLFENHVRTTCVVASSSVVLLVRGSASGTTARRTRYGTRSVPTDSIDGDDFCAAGNRYDIVVLEGGQKYALKIRRRGSGCCQVTNM